MKGNEINSNEDGLLGETQEQQAENENNVAITVGESIITIKNEEEITNQEQPATSEAIDIKNEE